MIRPATLLSRGRSSGWRRFHLLAVFASFALLVAACGPGEEAADETPPEDDGAADDADAATEGALDADEIEIGHGDVELIEPSPRTRGPQGEEPTSSGDLQLTDEQVEELSGMDLTGAALWQASFQFQTANTDGIESEFERIGAELIAVTDAQYDPAQQADHVETVMAQNPDMIFTWVIDPVQGAEAFRPAVDSGVQLALLSNLPEGYEHPDDYVGIVTDDLFGMGEAAAHLLAENIGNQGSVAWIFHDADAYVTNQRDDAFKEVIETEYPDIEIVAEEGFTEPAQALEITQAILLREPDLDGIYAAWAEPAASVVEALRAEGRDDVAVVTLDLDPAVAVDMANEGNVVGIIADVPFEIGRGLAVKALWGVLGEETPAFSIVPHMAVTRDNLITAWRESLRAEPPPEVLEALAE